MPNYHSKMRIDVDHYNDALALRSLLSMFHWPNQGTPLTRIRPRLTPASCFLLLSALVPFKKATVQEIQSVNSYHSTKSTRMRSWWILKLSIRSLCSPVNHGATLKASLSHPSTTPSSLTHSSLCVAWRLAEHAVQRFSILLWPSSSSRAYSGFPEGSGDESVGKRAMSTDPSEFA